MENIRLRHYYPQKIVFSYIRFLITAYVSHCTYLYIMKNFITTLMLSLALFAIFVGLVALSYSATPNRVYATDTSDRVGKVIKSPTKLTYVDSDAPLIETSLINPMGKVLGDSTSSSDEPSTYFSTFTSFVPFTDMHYATGHHVFSPEEIGVCYCGPQALRLQVCLSELGYFSQSQHFTGCFGRGETTRAIESFQRDYGIYEVSPSWAQHGAGDAWLGNQSISKLKELCYPESEDEPVVRRDGDNRRRIVPTDITTDPDPEEEEEEEGIYDLAINKVNFRRDEINNTVTFVINVINDGTVNSGEYTFKDIFTTSTLVPIQSSLPSGCVLDDLDTKIIHCSGANISPGEYETYVITFETDGNMTGRNFVEITSDSGDDIDSEPGSGIYDGEDDTSGDQIKVSGFRSFFEKTEVSNIDYDLYLLDPENGLGEDGTVTAGVGDTIYYIFTVENAGYLPLYDIEITDTSFSGTGVLGPITQINPGGIYPSQDLDGENDAPDLDRITRYAIFSAAYTLTQEDVQIGSLSNTANVTVESPIGPYTIKTNSEAIISN